MLTFPQPSLHFKISIYMDNQNSLISPRIFQLFWWKKLEIIIRKFDFGAISQTFNERQTLHLFTILQLSTWNLDPYFRILTFCNGWRRWILDPANSFYKKYVFHPSMTCVTLWEIINRKMRKIKKGRNLLDILPKTYYSIRSSIFFTFAYASIVLYFLSFYLSWLIGKYNNIVISLANQKNLWTKIMFIVDLREPSRSHF